MIKKNIFSLKFLFLTIKATFKSVLYWKIRVARNFGRGRRAQNKLRSCSWIIIHGLTESFHVSYGVSVKSSRGAYVRPTWGDANHAFYKAPRRLVVALVAPYVCYGDSSRCRYEGSPMVFGRFVPASPTSSTRLLRLEFNRAIPVTRVGTWRSINSRVI